MVIILSTLGFCWVSISYTSLKPFSSNWKLIFSHLPWSFFHILLFLQFMISCTWKWISCWQMWNCRENMWSSTTWRICSLLLHDWDRFLPMLEIVSKKHFSKWFLKMKELWCGILYLLSTERRGSFFPCHLLTHSSLTQNFFSWASLFMFVWESHTAVPGDQTQAFCTQSMHSFSISLLFFMILLSSFPDSPCKQMNVLFSSG